MFEQEFENMLCQYGDVIDDKRRFSGLVKDFFPNQTKNANLLLMAYNMGIAEDIAKASNINNAFAYRYVKQLVEDFGMSRANADWIVSIWCVCYGQKILRKNCEITLQVQGTGPAIKEEKEVAGKQYGDLFTYSNSIQGNGLAVTGFYGNKRDTIIFQNRANNTPVIEICDGVFANETIEEAIITEGIKYIGKNAFSGCINLHQVVLPNSIKEIDDAAFESCTNLKSISLPMSIEKLGNASLKNTGLKTINIPKTLYWIGNEALASCHNLVNAVIPENIDRIPKGMFENCTKLKKVSLHEKLDVIEDKAFFGCSELGFIVIPDSVKIIGEDAFTGTDKQFIIQCSFGSFAESYCRKNRIKYQLV